MKLENTNILPKLTASMAGDWNSSAIWIGHLALVSLQIVFAGGGSPVGTFKLQASCDEGKPSAEANAQQISGVTKWTDIPSQSQAVSADGSVLFNLVDPGYHWIRVVWDNTSGTATISSARLAGKGV